jgi:hypothetical protein
MSDEDLVMTLLVNTSIVLSKSYATTVRLDALMIVNEIIDRII